MAMLFHSVRNYRSPSRHWRLSFRVGDYQLATWSPKKKKKEKKKNRAVALLSQRRRADRERAFTDCETLLSPARACEALQRCVFTQFQPLLFPHVWWRDLKDTITARFFRKRRRADRQHELPSVKVSIVCETRIAKLPPVTCMRRCYSENADVCRGDQAVARVAHVSALQMQRKAYFRY